MLALQGAVAPRVGTVTSNSSLRRGAHLAPAAQLSSRHRPFTNRLPRRRAVLVSAEKDDNGKKKEQADQLVKGDTFLVVLISQLPVQRGAGNCAGEYGPCLLTTVPVMSVVNFLLPRCSS